MWKLSSESEGSRSWLSCVKPDVKYCSFCLLWLRQIRTIFSTSLRARRKWERICFSSEVLLGRMVAHSRKILVETLADTSCFKALKHALWIFLSVISLLSILMSVSVEECICWGVGNVFFERIQLAGKASPRSFLHNACLGRQALLSIIKYNIVWQGRLGTWVHSVVQQLHWYFSSNFEWMVLCCEGIEGKS